VDIDRVALVAVAWLATYVLHSTVLHGAAWLSCAMLGRIGRLQPSLGSLRERIWKVALLGGLATATIQLASNQLAPGIGPWNIEAALDQSAPISTARATPAPGVGELGVPVSIAPVLPESAPLPSLIGGAEERAAASSTRAVDSGTRVPRIAAARRRALDDDEPESTFARTMTLPSTWIRIVLGLWIGGVLFGLARWAIDWRRLAAALAERTEIAGGRARRALETVLGHAPADTHVRLFAAPRIDAPITLGFLRPAICLPPCAEHELGRDELEALLAHETAHVLRRDPAWLAACRAIEVVLFFQPLNRVARRRIADEAEYACDDWAVAHTRERIALASCLTEIAGWIVGGERELPAPGMAAHGSRLELRVRRLLDGKERSIGAGASRWMVPVACVAIAAVALFVPGVSARERSDAVADETLSEEFDPPAIESALASLSIPVSPASFPSIDPTVLAASSYDTSATPVAPAPAAAQPEPTRVTAPATPAPAASPSVESADADIAALESMLAALRVEASHRLTSNTFRMRLELLGQRLAALRKDRERLATLIHLSNLQAEASSAQAADVNSKLDDRK
jgi:beta-lactamase regulating signal transducer with metallopeptidase domain